MLRQSNNEIANEIIRRTYPAKERMDYPAWVREIAILHSLMAKDWVGEEKLIQFFGLVLREFAGGTKPVPTRAKTRETTFVSLAVCTDKTRPWMCNICAISKDEIAATDGHRIHRAKIEGAGYTVGDRFAFKRGEMVKIDYSGPDFPPLDQATPRHDKCKYNRVKVAHRDFVLSYGTMGDPEYRFDYQDTRMVFNAQYIDDAFAGRDMMRASFDGGSLDPMLIESKSGGRSAVVMPLRSDWSKSKS